jgi:hypothetical protein
MSRRLKSLRETLDLEYQAAGASLVFGGIGIFFFL